jgi:hypothetical protein
MPDVKQTDTAPTHVLNCDAAMQLALSDLLNPYGLVIQFVSDATNIPGSFFGGREAGLIGSLLYLRQDTPVHSALHEACHYICMSPDRRSKLDKDAEGDFDEENGVCYLQILLSNHLANVGSDRMMLDMDRWGYSFRLGSARAWFEADADDADLWLQHYDIINEEQQITWQCRLID